MEKEHFNNLVFLLLLTNIRYCQITCLFINTSHFHSVNVGTKPRFIARKKLDLKTGFKYLTTPKFFQRATLNIKIHMDGYFISLLHH